MGSRAGPLQLPDGLTQGPMHKSAVASKAGVEAEGGTYTPHPGEIVVEKMPELGRAGRLQGQGF